MLQWGCWFAHTLQLCDVGSRMAGTVEHSQHRKASAIACEKTRRTELLLHGTCVHWVFLV